MEIRPKPTNSSSARKPAERRRAWVTLPEPTTRATRTRRGINVLGVVIAVAAGIMLVPAIYRHQLERIPPARQRTSRMYDLVSITQGKAIERFGQPNAQKEYQLTRGSVLGPLLGQKNYVPLDSPDYAKRAAEAKVIWSYPEYSAVRELTWQLPDSYLTIWFQEPRGEISLSDDSATLALPTTGPGEWVALDNFRLGKDLVAPAGGNKPAVSLTTP